MKKSATLNHSTDNNPVSKLVTFIQFDEPALKVDEYTLKVTQTTNTAAPNSFTTSRNFAVSGERFSFQSGQIDSVFPPDLANGEFDGSLASVVLNRRTLPWERYLDTSNTELPWLAVLLFDADHQPLTHSATASDLITLNQKITVLGNQQLTGVGKLPADVFSYPGMNPLGYGETPDESCSVIDIDLTTFNRVAPSMNDMAYLAHIRQVDTMDTVKNGSEESVFSVVLGNRIAKNEQPAYAFLVSLENMGSYLPGDDGKPASFPAGIKSVRLICYRSWRFTANTMDQNFQQLLENLNRPAVDGRQITTLQFPATLVQPDDSRVQQALAAQANGQLDAASSQVLVQNAFGQGYIPMNHEMRHANTSVSWFRGPCTPFAVSETSFVSTGSADAANRYNPQTGLFDVSYGAAWQIGQLLALQNTSYANALFNWKKAVNSVTATQAEQSILQAALGANLAANQEMPFSGLLRTRSNALGQQPPLPDIVTLWLSRLKLLYGVPFNYLVPNEQMLPLESLRFFYLDLNWINHIVDGAFSIGRTCSKQQSVDASLFGQLQNAAHPVTLNQRRQRKGQRFAANAVQQYTGFLLRSQVVTGWPNVQVNGYAVADDISTEIKKLRMDRLSSDCIICIFDGEIKQVAIHEPPEQLHCGIEINGAPYSTTLRAVTGDRPGSQFLTNPKGGPPTAVIPMRADAQTLLVAHAATSIQSKLNNDFNQNIQDFTSAEFALEMIKGVVKVNFSQHN
ncbi:hypothetical protein [Collimonas sp.]|jgi:hypothetical protein|uniref:hypothetical protein n=1 Tax=Collimonas sp. TaxID=1963772 RepID=UPI002D145CBF|nr:hypothetical protein [Collimonas sp.]HWW07275.1 hypothetical protein [Collimonas sp.]